MASIGLGMIQGQNLANDAALKQLTTISGMANAAQAAEQADQYFQPGARESRKFIDEQSLEAVNNIKESMPLIKGMAVDPDTYVPMLLEKTIPHPEVPDAKWVVDAKSNGSYTARLVPTDGTNVGEYRSIPFDSKAQMVGTLSQNVTATAMDQLKNIQAVKAAADSSQIKLHEKLQEAAIKKQYELDPINVSKEKIAKYTADKGLAGAVYDADAGVLRAKIGKEAGGGEDTIKIAKAHLQDQGYQFDERDNIVGYRNKDLASMPAAEQEIILQRAREVRDLTFGAARKNMSPGRDPASIKNVGKAKGLPTKASHAPSSSKTPSKAAGLPARVKANQEDEAARDYYRMQTESAPGYKPRFY